MKAHVARSKTRLRFILGLKLKSKWSRVFCGSRKAACLRRLSSRRSPRRVSSSATSHVRVADHGAGTVINLGLLPDRSLDHRTGFLGRAAEFAYEAFDALIAA